MAERDPAAGRFWALQSLRLSGVVMVVLGAMILAGQMALPEVFGAALLVLGLVDFLVLPRLLARRWKSDR